MLLKIMNLLKGTVEHINGRTTQVSECHFKLTWIAAKSNSLLVGL